MATIIANSLIRRVRLNKAAKIRLARRTVEQIRIRKDITESSETSIQALFYEFERIDLKKMTKFISHVF